LTPDGWYKTGDVCIVDSDGVYKIVDRKKELIKVKGVRIDFLVLYSQLTTSSSSK
jgi:4-coumarate--CoA ligase